MSVKEVKLGRVTDDVLTQRALTKLQDKINELVPAVNVVRGDVSVIKSNVGVNETTVITGGTGTGTGGSLVGARGPEGPQGATGPAGTPGATGATGPTGPSGSFGPPPFDNTGTQDITDAMRAWLIAHGGEFGGVNYLPTGKYKMGHKMTPIVGAGLSYLDFGGDGLGTLIINGTLGVADNQPAMWTVQGQNGLMNLKRVCLHDMRVSGLGGNDITRLISFDHADGIELRNFTIENNGAEGVVSYGGENSMAHVTVRNFHALNVGQYLGRAAFNLNAKTTIINGFVAQGCGAGIETDGSFFQLSDFLIEDATNYGVLHASTWSGDVFNGVQTNARGARISNGIFRNVNGRCLLMPDYTGHPNAGYPANGGPAQLDGNLGQVIYRNILFDRIGTAAWGGADKWSTIDMGDFIISGQYDGGIGPATYALSLNGGYWYVHDGIFELGQGIPFASLAGIEFQAPDGVRQRVERNTIRGLPWYGASTPAFLLYSDSVIADTTFEDDINGTLASAAPTQMVYQLRDFATAIPAANIRFMDFDWRDKHHRFDVARDYCDIPLLTDTLPPTMTFKPGDVLRATGAQTWMRKRCLTGGTLQPTPLSGITATGTSGSFTVTMPAGVAGIFKYAQLAIVGISGPRRVMSIDSSTQITIETALNATVSAAAVSYAVPTWLTL